MRAAALGLAVAGAGAAYYLDVDLFEKVGVGGARDKVREALGLGGGRKEETVAVAADAEATAAPEAAEAAEGHRVAAIPAVPVDLENRPPQVVPEPEHPADGVRVSVERMNELWPPAGAEETGKEEEEVVPAEVIEIEPIVDKAAEAAEAEAVSHAVVSAEAAAAELRSASGTRTEGALMDAHRSLRANLDEAYLRDLDRLSEGELRIRVVQLAAEMEERTKWEAVRLKEFLAMKEKETADKYLEILQKQRLDFEDLLSRRLREQEDGLARQANAALQAKEDSIQSVISAAAEAQGAERDAELRSASERIDRECRAKYEAEYGRKLADEKAAFARELEEKVGAVERMAERLRKLEGALEVSRNFESGSQRAHRLSAAALALAAKMEAGRAAREELAAIQVAAGDEGVIGSALSKLPPSVKSGVPTLPELQSKFDRVYSVGRQAALVPEGRSGLGAQMMGAAFAALTVPPSPDAPPPPPPVPAAGDASATSDDDDGGGPSSSAAADRALSRARMHVRLGEIDRAVAELDGLTGQAAFAVRDWRRDAMDRIAVDRALGVIKMECAILNQSMSGAAAAAAAKKSS